MVNLKVAFHKFADNQLGMQFEVFDEQLRNRPSVRCRDAGIRVTSCSSPDIVDGNEIYLPGDEKSQDHRIVLYGFYSPEERDRWIRKARKAIIKYVRTYIPSELSADHERRVEVLSV